MFRLARNVEYVHWDWTRIGEWMLQQVKQGLVLEVRAGDLTALGPDALSVTVCRQARPVEREDVAVMSPKVYKFMRFCEMVDTLGLSPLARMRGKKVSVRSVFRSVTRRGSSS